jgi:hypothetical protein
MVNSFVEDRRPGLSTWERVELLARWAVDIHFAFSFLARRIRLGEPI